MTFCFRSTAAALLIAALSTPVARAQDTSVNPAIPMLGGWTGQFRAIQMTQDSRNSGGYVGRISGVVRMQPIRESGLDLYDVLIQISTAEPGQELEWGVSMGRCGSKLIMLEHANQLPGFETRNGGEGEVRHKMQLNLNAQASYQVGLFRNGHAQQNMVACANLKYDERMR